MALAAVDDSRAGLTELGYRIFLDRYARTDNLTDPDIGDVVLVKLDAQREIAVVTGRPRDDRWEVTFDRTGTSALVRREEMDLKAETRPAQVWDRVARWAADGADQRGRFHRLLEGWRFVPGGRIMAAAGIPGMTASNCYVLGGPHDSRNSIWDTAAKIGETLSRGGGTGINISTLRPRSSIVRGVGGRSSGPVSWAASVISPITHLIEQGGTRRGAQMIILECWHPDILEFVQAKRTPGVLTGCNVSVGVTDAFLAAVDNDDLWELVFPDTTDPLYDSHWRGDLSTWCGTVVSYATIPARELLDLIVQSAWASGEPGLWFRDRANADSNSYFYQQGRLVGTNPCQPAWATVATPKGIRTIGEVSPGDVIWDGTSWGTIARKTLTGVKKVYAYRTRAGVFYGTANHRILQRGEKVEVELAEAIDVSVVELPTYMLRGERIEEMVDHLDLQAVVDGLVLGDGTAKRFTEEHSKKYDRVLLCVGEGDHCYYNSEIGSMLGNSYGREDMVNVQTTLTLEEVSKTHEREVPERFYTGDYLTVRSFLRGLYSANGSVVANRVTLKTASTKIRDQVQVMLSFLGISSYYTTNKAKAVQFPNGEYIARESYDVDIGTLEGRTRFATLIGFIHPEKEFKLKATLLLRSGRVKRTYEIVEIEEVSEEEVYSLTMASTPHTYWTGGLHVANCGEQSLPQWGVCNLGHINLSKFVLNWRTPGVGNYEDHIDWDGLRETADAGVEFLDCLIDVQAYPLEQYREQQTSERRVGMGTLGLGEMLIRLGIRYGSDEALDVVNDVYGTICRVAYRASHRLAQQKGAFPHYGPSMVDSGFCRRLPDEIRALVAEGMRNVTLITQAPTGTGGTMVSTSSGIEPFYDLEWERRGLFGSAIERVRAADEWEELHGRPPDFAGEQWTTAMQLTPEEHVAMQAAVQQWTDSSISKTINLPESATVEDVARVYRLLHERGCKGGTVYRDRSRDTQVLHVVNKNEAARIRSEVNVDDRVRERPYKRAGCTVSEETPGGTAHVTMNVDAEGYPFEVFAELGKAGSELKANSEAMGRLISLVLRMPSPLLPRERVQEVVEQLRGIGGSEPVGLGSKRIGSLPDGIAAAMAKEWLDEPVRMGIDICPECGGASLVKEAGCSSCRDCGYSRC